MKKHNILFTAALLGICLTGCGSQLTVPAAVPEESVIITTTTAENVQTTSTAITTESSTTAESTTVTAAAATAEAYTAKPNTPAPAESSANGYNFSDITGKRYYQVQNPANPTEYDNMGCITINPDGTFYYVQDDNTKSFGGVIKVTFDEHPDGSKNKIYELYDENGALWEGFYASDNPNTDIIYTGQDGRGRLVSDPDKVIKNEEAAAVNITGDDYLGRWWCNRCVMDISKEPEGYFVKIKWADSAYEDNEWTYLCTFNEADSSLECPDGGTFRHIICQDNSEPETNTIYSDGSAKFNLTDSGLVWNDYKKGYGTEMYFTK